MNIWKRWAHKVKSEVRPLKIDLLENQSVFMQTIAKTLVNYQLQARKDKQVCVSL